MMSGADEWELPGLDTFSGLVLALTALSGELPAALVSRLPASDTYKEYAVKQLKRDNLLRTFYRNSVRGLRLTTTAKRRLMAPLMGVGGDKRHNYFVLDGNFEHFYYLPSDHHGEIILQLLCDPDEKAVLDGILCKGFDPPRPGWLTEHDAMDGDSPVLFAYTCDLPRIRRFNAALEQMGRSGTLFCFDFQADALKQVCGQWVKAESLDFEKVKALLFDGGS